MKPPMCKLCETRHWLDEEHQAGLDEVRKVGAMVLQTTQSYEPPVKANKRTEPLSGRNKRTRGRPKKWASEAERKKAYRSKSQ